MELFLELTNKIYPLYFFILAGFTLIRLIEIDNSSIARILIYLVVPFIVFNSSFNTTNVTGIFLLPVTFYIIACALGLLFFFLGKVMYKDTSPNLLAMLAGTANMGYFGLPVIIALQGENAMNTAIYCVLGTTFYENSLGFYLAARGNFSWKESLKKLAALPSIYAFITGIVLRKAGVVPGEKYLTFLSHVKGAYVVLGMMLIGLGIGAVRSFRFDMNFLSLSFAAKFLAWPLLVFAFIFVDKNYLHALSSAEYLSMMVLSVTPLSANSVAYATELDIQPGKAALCVFISTLAALVIIPLMFTLFS